MMHYYEASRYDRKIYYMECLSAFIGSMSCTSVGVCLLQKQDISLASFSLSSLTSDKGSLNPQSLGSLGAFGIGLVFVLQLLGKGSMKILPSFSRRQQLHVTAAAAWQKLAMKTRSYRIQLDNPKLDVGTYAKWYLDVISAREKLCTIVAVPQSTYTLYSDPRTVMGAMKNRRLMYLKYLQLEDLDKDDMEDIDTRAWDARVKTFTGGNS